MRLRFAICVLLLASVAVAQGNKASSAKNVTKPVAVATADKPAETAAPQVTQQLVEEFLNRIYGFNQDIKFKVAEIKKADAPGVTDAVVVASSAQGQQVVHFYILPDGGHVIMGDLVPFGADPFAENRERLLKESFGPTKGPADAPITIVEFADLQCPACRAAQRDVERLQEEYPQVKFVFQSFPLDMHPWANLAARYLDCVQRQNNAQSVNFMQTVFIHQDEITFDNAKEKLERYAGIVGADGPKATQCSEMLETSDRIRRSIAFGKAMKITGTPSMFINGHPAIMNDYEHLKALVDFELAHAPAKQ